MSRPVQREIDQLKGRGQRLGKRARATSTLLRPLVEGDMHICVRPSSPAVYVALDSTTRPDESHQKTLEDYVRPDDQIVGTVAAFARAHPDRDVRLLTHDMWPMESAKAVRVPFIPIPDEWLLEPESTDDEKRIAKLEAELDGMKKLEPRFKFAFLDAAGCAIEDIEAELVRYSPLSDDEVASLVAHLKTTLPRKSVAVEAPTIDNVAKMIGPVALGRTYVPVTAKDIATYERDYERWLADGADALRAWHKVANLRTVPPRLLFPGAERRDVTRERCARNVAG